MLSKRRMTDNFDSSHKILDKKRNLYGSESEENYLLPETYTKGELLPQDLINTINAFEASESAGFLFKTDQDYCKDMSLAKAVINHTKNKKFITYTGRKSIPSLKITGSVLSDRMAK
jgi:hypothetical protein